VSVVDRPGPARAGPGGPAGRRPRPVRARSWNRRWIRPGRPGSGAARPDLEGWWRMVVARQHGGGRDRGAAAPCKEPEWESDPLEEEDAISRYLT
jgi:hypothetical protein